MEQNRQEQNQEAADDQPSCDGNNKGGHWLRNSLKIVGRKNVKGQKQERKRVYPNDSRRNCKNRRSGAHKNTDIKVRTSQTDSVTDRICSVTCPNPSYKNFTLAISLLAVLFLRKVGLLSFGLARCVDLAIYS